MKKIYIVLIFLITQVVILGAQDFNVGPNPALVEGVANGLPLIAYAEIVNDTYESQTVVWKRTLEDLPEGWTSNVCTSQGCALADVNEGTFSMIPLEGLNVDIQFNTEWIAGGAVVELELYFESKPDSIITVVYHGDALASGILEEQELKFEIYPNPVENFFELKGAENVHQIKVIHILGNHSLVVDSPFEKIYVDDLPSGIYQVAFYNEEGVLLKTKPLIVF